MENEGEQTSANNTMLVTGVICVLVLIVAAVAIPGLMRGRINANEGSTSAGLRSLAAAQTNFQKAHRVDQDQDGTGEYGVLNELCGATNLRGTVAGAPELMPLTNPDMPISFQVRDGLRASKSGYYLKLFLPGPDKIVTDHNSTSFRALPPLNPNVPAEDAVIQAQENRWICYAWPITYRHSGVRAFVVDTTAEVYASDNTDNIANRGWWHSTESMPNWSSAMKNTPVPPDVTNWMGIAVKDNANAVDQNHTWLTSGCP